MGDYGPIRGNLCFTDRHLYVNIYVDVFIHIFLLYKRGQIYHYTLWYFFSKNNSWFSAPSFSVNMASTCSNLCTCIYKNADKCAVISLSKSVDLFTIHSLWKISLVTEESQERATLRIYVLCIHTLTFCQGEKDFKQKIGKFTILYINLGTVVKEKIFIPCFNSKSWPAFLTNSPDMISKNDCQGFLYVQWTDCELYTFPSYEKSLHVQSSRRHEFDSQLPSGCLAGSA